ncbi:hypothetical protein O0L34_g17491 [Tuta absoluta]|nr:hypothetical protein O0L34_g17491 [Tuta absoluta]
MDEESLCKICVLAFPSDVIVKSKSLLFESLPAENRKITRKKSGKEQRDMEDIINLYKATPLEYIPVFVARDLHILPPVTFDHIDITDLLKMINVLRAEMNEVKSSCVSQDQLQEV